MRLRVMLLISLGVNLGLGAVLYLALRFPAPTDLAVVPPKAHSHSSSNQVKTQVVVRRQFFTWGEVESADYPTYIANLRAIGCPEPTIRDIIVADVNQLFARRRATEIVSPDQQWWRSEPDPVVLQAAADKLAALDSERRALLTRLLGSGWESAATGSDASVNTGISLSGPVLGSLPVETKQAVLEISARAQQRLQAYLDTQGKAGKPVDPAEVARLRQKTREELAKVLTPDQLEEYRLRYSGTAGNLRTDLRGLNVTPDEFRSLFRARDAIESQSQLYSGDDPVSVQRRQDLAQQLEAAVKQALDPDRYQIYQLTKDPLYRAAQTTATQIGAPAEKVMPLYEINQLTATERKRILDDASLTDEEKAGALKLIQQDLGKSLQKILGADAYRLYQQHQTPNPQTQNQAPPLPEGLKGAVGQPGTPPEQNP
jgi:hypothetical protein